jgi:hypothetical protein
MSRRVLWYLNGLLFGLSLFLAARAWGLADQYTITDLGLAYNIAIAKEENRAVGSRAVNGNQIAMQFTPNDTPLGTLPNGAFSRADGVHQPC